MNEYVCLGHFKSTDGKYIGSFLTSIEAESKEDAEVLFQVQGDREKWLSGFIFNVVSVTLREEWEAMRNGN